MYPLPPRWLRERTESNTRFSDGGTWKFIALLVGIVTLLGTAIIWLWRNLANFP